LIDGQTVDFLSQTVLNVIDASEMQYSTFGVTRQGIGSVRAPSFGTIHQSPGTIKEERRVATVRFQIAPI